MFTHPKLSMCSFARLHHLFVAWGKVGGGVCVVGERVVCVGDRAGGRASERQERGAHKNTLHRLRSETRTPTTPTHTRTHLDPDLISNEYIYISKSKVRKYLLVLLNRKKVSKSK